jgi:hypothetical protein
MTNIAAGLNYQRKGLVEVLRAMRDFSRLVYGRPAAMMIDEDPRLEIDSGARLIAFWTDIGCSEEWQREQIDCYDQAKEALAVYRALKAGEGVVLVNRAIAHEIPEGQSLGGRKSRSARCAPHRCPHGARHRHQHRSFRAVCRAALLRAAYMGLRKSA